MVWLRQTRPVGLILSRLISTRGGPQPPKLPTLKLFTRYPCPLCDESKAELAPLAHRFRLEEVDITRPENALWFERYRYEIPVFHLEDQFLCQNRIDLERLEAALARLD